MAKILIVDDDVETTNLLESVVKMNGHQAFSVNASRNALNSVATVMPDLILMDIMMADINGIALCKLIKADPETSRIAIVMVSALNDEGSKRDSFNAGATDFITKPIQVKELGQRIKSVLGE